MQKEFTIQFFSVGCGDAIAIRFFGTDSCFHNVLIDAGYAFTYKTTVRNNLIAIQKGGESVDLWCITHTDDDHINGINSFLKDPLFKNMSDFVKEYWFNWSDYPAPNESGKMSVRKGLILRDYLKTTGKLKSEDITTTTKPLDFFGAKITLLSPDMTKLEASKIAWQRKERTIQMSSNSDYGKSIQDLMNDSFEEDDALFNGGSIAFLFEFEAKKLLFLADSYPSVVEASLHDLGYSATNKLYVDWVKVSHHGSKKNTSPELLNLIDCPNFIISANGIKHNLPDKATLTRILKCRNKQPTHFWFTHKTPALQRLFAIDGTDVFKTHNFSLHFPIENSTALCIPIL